MNRRTRGRLSDDQDEVLMLPSFREDKTTQAAALLLRWAGGRMNYM
jgi:hypothetical protein